MGRREVVEKVPYPVSWRTDANRQKKSIRYVLVVCTLLALLMSMWPESPVGRMSWLLVAVAGSGIAALIGRAILWRCITFNSFGMGTFERPSLIFRESAYSILVRIYVPLAVISMLLVYYLSRDEILSDPTGGRSHDRMVVYSQIAPYCIALMALYFPIFLLGRRKILGLGLAQEGVYHWWWGGCSFYPWERIQDLFVPERPYGARVDLVPCAALEGYSNSEENWLGRSERMRVAMRKLQLGTTRVHPGLLYQALCFYLRHPELREELGDQRAVQRMKQGDFGEIPDEIRTHGYALPPDGAAR